MKSPWQLLASAGRYSQRHARNFWRGSIAAARGAIDGRKLAATFPFLANFQEEAVEQRRKLQPLHERYVASVSAANAAISLELAVFLAVLCQARRPRRILDLGSGFSSLVLRSFAAAQRETVVVSVDDSPQWLAATQAYLQQHSQSTDQLMPWNDFQTQPLEPFDLVLHDLGDMRTRERALPQVLDLLAVDGLIVLDDMHKPGYAKGAMRMLGERRFDSWNLHRYTADSFGRFAVLAQRPRQTA